MMSGERKKPWKERSAPKRTHSTAAVLPLGRLQQCSPARRFSWWMKCCSPQNLRIKGFPRKMCFQRWNPGGKIRVPKQGNGTANHTTTSRWTKPVVSSSILTISDPYPGNTEPRYSASKTIPSGRLPSFHRCSTRLAASIIALEHQQGARWCLPSYKLVYLINYRYLR